MGHIAEDTEIWEGNEIGAYFKVTKETMPLSINIRPRRSLLLYSLSVFGLMLGKEKVVGDFIEVLGTPVFPQEDLSSPWISMIAWETSQVDRILKRYVLT